MTTERRLTLQKPMKTPEIPKHITDVFDAAIKDMQDRGNVNQAAELVAAIQHLGLFVRTAMEEYTREMNAHAIEASKREAEYRKHINETLSALDRMVLKLYLQPKDPDMDLTREELAYAESLKFKHEKTQRKPRR